MAGILIQVILLCVMLGSASGRQEDFKPRITHLGPARSTFFPVHWERPIRAVGEIIQYEVAAWKRNHEYEKTVVSIRGNRQNLVMRDVEPYTTYLVQVSAVTRSGRSPPSDPMPVLTDTAPASPPLNIEVIMVSPRSVTLRWQQPETFYRSIDSYEIELFSEGRRLRSLSTEDTMIDIIDLQPGKEISLRLYGVTKSLYHDDENYDGQFAQSIFSLPPEPSTEPPQTDTTGSPSVRTTIPTTSRTSTTPGKQTRRPPGRATPARSSKASGRNPERLASRTATAKLNWLRSGTREQLAQTRLANIQADLASLQKVKLELEIAKLKGEF